MSHGIAAVSARYSVESLQEMRASCAALAVLGVYCLSTSLFCSGYFYLRG